MEINRKLYVIYLMSYWYQMTVVSAESAFKSDNVHYTFSSTFNTCITKGNRIRTLSELSVTKCIQECKQRKSCEILTYRRRPKVCELYSGANYTVETYSDCTSVKSVDIATSQDTCTYCQFGQACNMVTQSCVYKECPSLPGLNNGRLLGNSLAVGSRLRIICNTGYSEKNGLQTIMCRDNGTWSNNPECILDNLIGQSCSNDVDCMDVNAMCRQKFAYEGQICMCKPLYQLNNDSRSCKECTSYTSEYNSYPDTDVPGSDIDFYFGSSNFEKCREFCESRLGESLRTFVVVKIPSSESCWCKQLSVQQYVATGFVLGLTSDIFVYERKCQTVSLE